MPGFFRRRKPAPPAPFVPLPEAAAPDSAALHVLAEDGLVRLEDGFLVARRGDGAAARMRLDEVAQLALHGHAGVTTPCVMALLTRGIPVIYRSATGFYLGQTVDLSGTLAAVRRAQYAAAADPQRCLAIARALVAAKLGAARAMLRRHAVSGAAPLRLATLRRDAEAAGSLASLLGIEGSAAALYFAALPQMIAPARRSDFSFSGRRRRPPGDAVNALLSYLYAILTGECAAAALGAGLDPTVGFLHAERAGRPALALDLVEPLRRLIADPVALGLINRGELAAHHFAAEGAAVLLTEAGRRAVLGALERRLAESDLRRRLAAETHRLATALRKDEIFVPGLVAP